MNAINMSQRKSSVVGFFKFRLLLLQNDSQGRGAHELQKLCVTSLGFVATLCLVVYFTDLSIPDLFASVLAFIPTGWAILCLSHGRGLWDSVCEIARLYDVGVGMIKFAPVAILSWFPFASTFQSRLLLNQAFSHGLEISLILAGNKANIET